MSENPARTLDQLKRQGWGEDDIDAYRMVVAKRDALLDRIAAEPKVVNRLLLQRELDGIEDSLRFAGRDPRLVPVDILDRMRRAKQPMDDPTTAAYRAKIRTRASAIRTFCVDCQGGEVKGVRECEAMNCPLWPFRMGTDPLRGKVKAIVMDEPLVDETGEVIIEEEDDDETEADATE